MVFTGESYDNTGDLGASTWRHVAFIERPGANPTTGFADVSWFEGDDAPDVVPPLGPDPSGEFSWLMMSDVCKHCVHSGCLDVCPTGSLIRTEYDSVYLQPDVCNGCGMCIPACPFGVIDRNEQDGRAWKCTLCYDRLQGGMEPACAKSCPTDSIVFGDIDDLREIAEQRVQTLHERGLRAGLPVRRGRGRPARHRRAQRVLPADGPPRGLQPAARPGGPDGRDRRGVALGAGRRAWGCWPPRSARWRWREQSMSETLRALDSPAASTEPGEGPTYYGRPAIKEPVWIWSVPAYLFVGGVGAGASTVAGAAQVLDREQLDWLVTRGRWVSVAAGATGTAFLIHDLGRPSRFLNMLRVFRPSSAMSMGSWTLATFSGAATTAAVAPLVFRNRFGRGLGNLGGLAAMLLGPVLGTYTGVLLADTAVPVWAHTRKELPLLFGASAVAGTADVLDLLQPDEASEHVTRRWRRSARPPRWPWPQFAAGRADEHPEVGRVLHEGVSGDLWKASKALTAASLPSRPCRCPLPATPAPGRDRRARHRRGHRAAVRAVAGRHGLRPRPPGDLRPAASPSRHLTAAPRPRSGARSPALRRGRAGCRGRRRDGTVGGVTVQSHIGATDPAAPTRVAPFTV